MKNHSNSQHSWPQEYDPNSRKSLDVSNHSINRGWNERDKKTPVERSPQIPQNEEKSMALTPSNKESLLPNIQLKSSGRIFSQ